MGPCFQDGIEVRGIFKYSIIDLAHGLGNFSGHCINQRFVSMLD